jgi:hypothetical protein
LNVVDSAGKVGIITVTPTGTLDVTSVSTSTRGLVLRAPSGQTAAVFEYIDYNNLSLISTDSYGRINQRIRVNNATSFNTAFGYNAFNTPYIDSLYNGNGGANVAIGYASMQNISGVSYGNIGIGYQTLQNTKANYNVAIGYNVLQSMLTGSENIGIGGQVMNTNTAGDGNIGIGRQALYVASGGSFNIAIGSYASNALGGTYSYNTSVGYNSTRLLASGQYNTAFGYQALYHSTTDDYNIAIGANAGNSKIGSQNIYIQNNQMDYIGANSSSGIRNIVMGYRADLIGTPASYNVIAGSLLFYSGNYNVHIGNHTQPYSNFGDQNTVLGHDAFMNYNNIGAATPMQYNTFIGGGVGTRNYVSTQNVVVGMQIPSATNAFGPATWVSGIRNIGVGAPYVAQTATGNWSGLTGNDNVEFITNFSNGIIWYSDETTTTRHIKSNKLNIQRTIVGDTSTKRVFIGNANSYTNLSPDATLQITPLNASDKILLVKGVVSQSANYFEIQNSAGTPLLAITPSGSISGAISPTLLTSTGNLTLTDVHHGYIIEQTGVSASGTFTLGTITIPTWNCSIVNIGSGVIVASGSNTMRSPGGLNKSRTQYSSISIYRRGDGSFILGGDLA